MIMGAEFFIDWMKHAFIIKFNNLTVDIYPEYRTILAEDYIRAQHPTNGIEYADQIRYHIFFGTIFLTQKISKKQTEFQ